MYLSRWWNMLRARLRTFLRRTKVEQELAKELRFHLERQKQENAARGMTADEARECRDPTPGWSCTNSRGVPRYAPNTAV